MHEPLSHCFVRVLQTNGGARVSLNQLLERTEGRGVFPLIILLCLPFIGPVSLAGMSTPFGLAIATLAWRMARDKAPRLPRRIGDKPLPPRMKKALLGSGVRFLRGLEKLIKPRQSVWMAWPSVHRLNALLVVLMAVLLALPLPPIPPFTNALPSYAIILLAASSMEEDAAMIWAGYAAALGTLVYFAVWIGVIATHFARWWAAILGFLGLGR